MTKQVRFIPAQSCGLRIRETEGGEGQEQSRTVEGQPIVFGVRSVNLTPWSDRREVYEILEPGCLSEELLRESDVVLNINHSTKVTDIFGRHRGTDKDTLKLSLTPEHVESECDLPHTNNANDTLELIRRGDISGMSFAFTDDREDTENGVSYERTDEVTEDGKEVWLRHVKRITGLYDVSIVTYPAYEQTTVASREQGDEIMKSIDAQVAAQEDAKKRETEGGPKTEEPKTDDNDQTQETPEEKAQREAEEKAKQEAEDKAKKEAEEKAKQEREHAIMMANQRERQRRMYQMREDYFDSL